ncbi:MAG: ATP-binding cassette domain-containing protein [Sphingomicrobium sp.]
MSAAQGSGIKALLRDYRRYAGARLWLAFALMLLGALAEGFGILLIVPLAAIATGASGTSGPFGRLAGLAAALPPDRRLIAALGLFVGAMVVRSALVYLRQRLLARLQWGYEASLRLRAAATLAERGWTFASRVGQAGMQSLLLNDVPRASTAVSQMQLFVVAAVMLAVQMAIAALLSPELTAVALLVLALGGAMSVGWARRGARSGIAIVERQEESASSGFRLHSALKAALAQGTVPQFLAEFRSSLAGVRRELVRFQSDIAASRALIFLASAIAAAVLFFVGFRLLALDFPILVTSLVLFARMAGPGQQLQQTAQNVAAYAPSFAAIEQRVGKLGRTPDAAARAAEPLAWTELRVENARHMHQPGLGLARASLTLRRGEWLGVGGPSGAGKTTLVDLVAGLVEPQDGSITVDGRPLEGQRLERWRAGLAYVGQEGSVFDDSVRGNLVAESGAASDEELWRALDLVGLAARIKAFASGLDERVGDRGSALSGGERQRLVIARALLRRPSLLLLDEATAALDADGESALLQRLRDLSPRPAAVLVAHRASTLAHCESAIEIQHDGEKKSGD